MSQDSPSNNMPQLLISLTVAFYFFSQFIFGVIFMFTGFSYTGDEFCSMSVNGTLLLDPDKLLGPSGAIVEWNKMMGIVLILSTLSVTIVCLVIFCVDRVLEQENAEPVTAKHVTLILVGGLTIVQLVLTCLGINYIFGKKVQLVDTFDGTYEGPLEHYLGCKIARDLVAGTTRLFQTHYPEQVLRTCGFWDKLPRVTPIKPNTRLSKDNCDPSTKPNFHKRYRGIVGYLGYVVTMTRPDLALSYSELSKYLQFPGQSHMEAAENELRYLQ